MATTTRDHYMIALDVLANAARALITLADTVGIDEMREMAGRMETLAPVLEPTTYNRGGGLNLADQRLFLDATAEYIAKLKTLDRR